VRIFCSFRYLLFCDLDLRGTEKVHFLKSLGVDHVVDLSHENVTQSIKDFLKARNLKGVDVLYDPVGGKLTKEVLRLLNWGAHILVIGFASGEVPVIPANIALVKVPLYIKYFGEGLSSNTTSKTCVSKAGSWSNLLIQGPVFTFSLLNKSGCSDFC
jgi:NADPH:quinone reductase-like Zn-dependent oxidoreductase